MKQLVFATSNLGKLAELGAMLGPAWSLKSMRDYPEVPEVVESADTFEGNARLKALALAKHTGLLSLGDDSGLCVDALGGRPGVSSARYAANDEARNTKLLLELASVPSSQRTARFVCALVAAVPAGRVTCAATGTCEGRIVFAPRGSNGFGYDPVFEPALRPGETMAEMSRDEKAAISHRGAAFRALVTMLNT